jgi:hypothetical protein
LRRIVGDELFRTPVHVEVRGNGIDDAFLAKHLSGVRSTEFLAIQSEAITDDALAAVSRLSAPEMLEVVSSGISDVGLAHVGRMQQLDALRLTSPHVTDVGAACLAELKLLEALTLDGAQLTPDGIRRLKGLERIRYVHLVHDPLNEIPLENLRQETNLVFSDLPLVDALEFFSLDTELQLDTTEVPEDRRLRPITLVAKRQLREECLRRILEAADLDYYFYRGTIKITTPDLAAPRRAGERACRETFPSAERIEVDW